MTCTRNSISADLYATVTAQIVTQLEAGARPWAASWNREGGVALPQNASGRAYRGINVPLLWMAQGLGGFASNSWLTFKQALDLGGNVRKGEKSIARVYFFDTFAPKGQDADEEKRVPFLKQYPVFNVDQCEGLDLAPPVPPAPVTWADDERAARFVVGTGASVTDSGARCYYVPSADRVYMAERNRWNSANDYYATLLHELVHWTGHESRLDRKLTGGWDRAAYAGEELVAEMGAAFLCAALGLSAEPREDHASYLAGWLSVLKADNRAIFRAASAAQKAADFLTGLQHFEAETVTEQLAA